MTFTPDCQFLTELPPGYDERAVLLLAAETNVIVLAHPDMPPLVLNEKTRKFEEIKID